MITKEEMGESTTKVLQYVIDVVGETGQFPSIRDIMHHIGAKSTAVPVHHLNKLAKMGIVENIGDESTGRTPWRIVGAEVEVTVEWPDDLIYFISEQAEVSAQ